MKHTFKIRVEFGGALDEDGNEISLSPSLDKWTFPESHDIVLENNAHSIERVPIYVPKSAISGTYLFNINVCYDGAGPADAKCTAAHPNLYAPTNQITVVI